MRIKIIFKTVLVKFEQRKLIKIYTFDQEWSKRYLNPSSYMLNIT